MEFSSHPFNRLVWDVYSKYQTIIFMAKRSFGLRPICLNILLVWMSAASGIYAQHQPLSNCITDCDGREIPYPFGVGEGCYRDKGFEILCSSSTHHKPVLGVTGIFVDEISLEDAIVTIAVSPAEICYEEKSGKAEASNKLVFPDLTQSPFILSDRNYLYAIGCDISAHFIDSRSHEDITWCRSECTDAVDDSDEGMFDWNDLYGRRQYCKSRIPNGLKTLNLTLDSIRNQTSSASNSDGCSYAGITRSGYTRDEAFLDWAIGNETCRDAKKKLSTFACRDNNSICIDSTYGGYYCTCKKGYSGNPYLNNRCIVFVNCSETCVPEANCHSTESGNNRCMCPSGWEGEGTYSGSGCKKKHKTSDARATRYIFIGIFGGAGLFVFLAGGVFLLYRIFKKRKQIKLKKKFFKQNGGLLLEQRISSDERNNERTKIFVAEDFERATDNFSENRILGTGGSGTVYKGMLSDGRTVAIKKSKVVDESQIGQFINEVVILCQINHRHVVQVIGCCLETEVPLLAYEFISNGTLSHHLHDEECKSSLSWDNRLRIATEISGALSYMHSSTTQPIFHRDIKTCNILLDENLKAKVSDFGISKSVPFENTHLTTIVKGTYGYLDPEYYYSGQFTDKSDVYSFGVVLTELLTGEKPFSSTRLEDESYLVMQFTSCVEDDSILGMLEGRVLNEGNKEELLVVAKLAQRCLQLQGKKRPTMREVTLELEQLRPVDKQQYIPPNDQEDADYIVHDSSRASTSRLESEETTLIWENQI